MIVAEGHSCLVGVWGQKCVTLKRVFSAEDTSNGLKPIYSKKIECEWKVQEEGVEIRSAS